MKSALLLLALGVSCSVVSVSASLCQWNTTLSVCMPNVDEMNVDIGLPTQADAAIMDMQQQNCTDKSELATSGTAFGTRCTSDAPAYCKTVTGVYTPTVDGAIYPKNTKVTISICGVASQASVIAAMTNFELTCAASASGDLNASNFASLSASCQALYKQAYGTTPQNQLLISAWTSNVTAACVAATSQGGCTSASTTADGFTKPEKVSSFTSAAGSALPGVVAAVVVLLAALVF